MNWKKIKNKYPNAYKLCNVNQIYCDCDLEEFFDNQEIYIEVEYEFTNSFSWSIQYDHHVDFSERNLISRKEAKNEAIEKAFEILENKIK
jgi:hypothetical protein